MSHPHRKIHVVGLGGTLRPGSSSTRALQVALRAAEEAGSTMELLDLDDLELPLFRPGLPLDAFGAGATRLVAAARSAGAMLWSTSGYHGSLAGATKNALDFLEFLSRDDPPYLEGRAVGLIATAAGEMAAVNAANSMIPIAHALRASVVPLVVPIGHAGSAFARDGRLQDEHRAAQLGALGRLVVQLASPAPAELAAPLSA